MRVNNYRKLLTALSVFTTSLTMAAMPLHAGFEWTPPEKIEPQLPPVIQEPPTPVPPVEVVTPSIVENIPQSVETPEAPVVTETINTEVLVEPIEDVNISQEVIKTEDLINENIPEQPTEAVIEVVDQIDVNEEVQEIQEEIVAKPIAPPEPVVESIEWNEQPVSANAEQVTSTITQSVEDVVETQAESQIEIQNDLPPVSADVEKLETVATDEIVAINPFPKGEQNVATELPEIGQTVIPEDTEKTLAELSSEDVLSETTDKTTTEKIFWAKEEKFSVIEGFGNDMPLALAIRQIVPARYAFSFGLGVNPAQRINWKGGKPWNEVLSDALAPNEITYKIATGTLISFEQVKSEQASLSVESSESGQKKSSIVSDIDKKIKLELTPSVDDTKLKIVDPVQSSQDKIDRIEALSNTQSAPAPEAVVDLPAVNDALETAEEVVSGQADLTNEATVTPLDELIEEIQ